MDLRATQKPLKERYRKNPDAARNHPGGARRRRATCRSAARSTWAERHTRRRVTWASAARGLAACSGDFLLGALAACAQLTCQMVATTHGYRDGARSKSRSRATSTCAAHSASTASDAGFAAIRLRLDVAAPEATAEELAVATREDGALLHGHADPAATAAAHDHFESS